MTARMEARHRLGRPAQAALAAVAALALGASAACSGGGAAPSAAPAPANPPAAPPAAPQQNAPPAGTAEPPPASGAGAPPPAQTQKPSALFVLGDSLSDSGNAGALADYLLDQPVHPASVGLCNPADTFVIPRACEDLFYRRSRVSDGPVAVEHVAAHFGLPELVPSFHVIPERPGSGTNYAVASAKARAPEVEDLLHQVDRLLLEHGPLLPEDALYVVMIGGNDALDALKAAVPDAEVETPPDEVVPDEAGGDGAAPPAPGGAAPTSGAIVTAAVAATAIAVERLIDFGARRLVVANVPDLAALPAVRAAARAAADEAAVLAAAGMVSAAFNAELAAALERIAAERVWMTSLTLTRFDLRAALGAAQAAAAASGGNPIDACFDSELYRASSTAVRAFHADCAPAGDEAPRFDAFAFWDGIHPSGAAHEVIGAALIAAVEAGRS